MDQSTLSKKERGERALNIDELLRFAAVLDVSPLELLLPRTTDDDLQLSGSVTLPAAQAREWIRGWRQLERFHGVPNTALVLPDQKAREKIKGLEAEIERVDIEIQVRQDLIPEAEVRIEALRAEPTLWGAEAKQFVGWVEETRRRIQELKARRTELDDEAKEAEREAQGVGWLHRDPPAPRSP